MLADRHNRADQKSVAAAAVAAAAVTLRSAKRKARACRTLRPFCPPKIECVHCAVVHITQCTDDACTCACIVRIARCGQMRNNRSEGVNDRHLNYRFPYQRASEPASVVANVDGSAAAVKNMHDRERAYALACLRVSRHVRHACICSSSDSKGNARARRCAALCIECICCSLRGLL